MKKIIHFCIGVLCFALLGCSTSLPATFDPTGLGEEPLLDIHTTYGVITVKLFRETPLHRDNFVKLAAEGYYNGQLWHRAIASFVIQSGDPTSRTPQPGVFYGDTDTGYTIPAEFVSTLTHKRGAVCAARESDDINPEQASSGSQFYIVVNSVTTRPLNGKYTVFGETVDGFAVLDKIAAVTTDANDRPLKDVFITHIRPTE